jgi:hypothetical protein
MLYEAAKWRAGPQDGIPDLCQIASAFAKTNIGLMKG